MDIRYSVRIFAYSSISLIPSILPNGIKLLLIISNLQIQVASPIQGISSLLARYPTPLRVSTASTAKTLNPHFPKAKLHGSWATGPRSKLLNHAGAIQVHTTLSNPFYAQGRALVTWQTSHRAAN